jgi:hypothetical protein
MIADSQKAGGIRFAMAFPLVADTSAIPSYHMSTTVFNSPRTN